LTLLYVIVRVCMCQVTATTGSLILFPLSHKMPPSNNNTNNKNSSKLPQEIETKLLKHLLSPSRLEPLSSFEDQFDLGSTPLKAVRNRFAYLKRIFDSKPDSFIDLCLYNKVDIEWDAFDEDCCEPTPKELFTSSPAASPNKQPKNKRTDTTPPTERMTSFGAPKGAFVINVDPDFPEKNREVLVVATKNIPGVDGKTYYAGYTIMYRFDGRWLVENPDVECIEARLLTTHSILLKVPAWPYGILRDQETINAKLPSHVQDALDNAASESPSQFKYLVLEFGEDHELSSKVLHKEAGENEELSIQVLGHQSSCSELAVSNSVEHWAVWEVARTDVQSHKKGKVGDAKKDSKVLSMLKGMNIG
jgi:hypothetical protein